MNNWLTARELENTQTVLVTVASVEGSGPRETGAKMLVTAHTQIDTIGGGHLEHRACEIAREMLAAPADDNPPRRLERFALGPSLGQCCGGVVHLAFERIARQALENFNAVRESMQQQEDCWRLIALDDATPPAVFDRAGRCVSGQITQAPLELNYERPCHVMRDHAGHRWLIDPCRAHRPHLILFGAGHVGAAIVRALADLPCQITWVDQREDLFPATVPANVQIEATDTPECVADNAPPGATFLVLTHSHALDQVLSEHILRRPSHDWFGLIGSRTKRMQFEHRLAERGIPRQCLAEMVCPIGVPGITGKAPAVIAASVVAQLLQVWEAAERATTLDAQPRAITQLIANA
jgi:xanthine dehydrogenase accessory factor